MNGLKPEIQLPKFEKKKKENLPFTDKTEQAYIDNNRSTNDRWDYAGGATLGQ